jgi:hypothetical protein
VFCDCRSHKMRAFRRRLHAAPTGRYSGDRFASV